MGVGEVEVLIEMWNCERSWVKFEEFVGMLSGDKLWSWEDVKGMRVWMEVKGWKYMMVESVWKGGG